MKRRVALLCCALLLLTGCQIMGRHVNYQGPLSGISYLEGGQTVSMVEYPKCPLASL